MNRIAKNYILNLAYEIIALAVPLLTAPYLTRVLHSENYGIYSYVQSVANIIITISLLGIYTYGNRQVAYCRDNPIELSNTFWELMTLRFVLGLVGTAVYFAVSISNKFSRYFAFYYAFFLSNIIDCSWIYVGLENVLPCVIKNLVAKIVTLIGVFIIVKTEQDVGKYIILTSTSSLLANLSVFTQLKGIVKKPRVSVPNIVKHLKGSVFLFLPQMASILYLEMDKAMLEWLTDSTSLVSFYDQAQKIITIPLSFITVLSTVMMPRIANDYKKGNYQLIEYHINKAGVFSLFLAFPMTIGIGTIALKMVPWYLGNDYLPTAYAIIIICPIIISNTLLGITGKQYFTATNRIIVLTASNSIAAIINLIVNIILIPRYGYVGAAIATLIASYVNVIIQMSIVNKSIHVNNILKNTIKYFLLSVIMGGVIIGVTRFFSFEPSVLTTIIQILLGVIVYFGLLAVLKDAVLIELFALLMKRIKKQS